MGWDGVTRSDAGSPGTASGAPTPGTVAPWASSTRTSESFAFGASENVRTICRGETGTDESAAGSELSSAECAAATAGTTAAQTTATSSMAVRTSAGDDRPGLMA